MIDTGVVQHFKALADGRGYQTMINDVLKKSMEQENLEIQLRKIIREELGKGKMAG